MGVQGACPFLSCSPGHGRVILKLPLVDVEIARKSGQHRLCSNNQNLQAMPCTNAVTLPMPRVRGTCRYVSRAIIACCTRWQTTSRHKTQTLSFLLWNRGTSFRLPGRPTGTDLTHSLPIVHGDNMPRAPLVAGGFQQRELELAGKLKLTVLIFLLLLNAYAWCVAFVPPQRRDSAHTVDARLTEVELGTPLPQITVYDDQGNEFEFASLQGTYSVVTFGCLT